MLAKIMGDSSLVADAYDAGINFFLVTVDMHWPLYEGARGGLATLFQRGRSTRDDVAVAGISYAGRPEFASRPFRELIDAVPGLDRVDVAILGGTGPHDFLVRLPAYHEHRDNSPTGAACIAASFHDLVTARIAVDHELVDLALFGYNPFQPFADDLVFPRLRRPSACAIYTQNAMPEFLTEERLAELGVPWDVWHPTPSDYYRFALSPPAVDGVVAVIRNREELDSVVAALNSPALTADECGHFRDLGELHAGTAKVARDDGGG